VATNFPSDEIFLTTEEVLEYLQVNLRTVYRLIKAGKIPAVRVGRQWRFRKRDIDAWLDSQRPRSGERPVVIPLDKPQGRAGRPRILVVDDEASIRELLSKLSDGSVLVIESEQGVDYPKTRTEQKTVVEGGENKLFFTVRVHPPLRVARYRKGS